MPHWRLLLSLACLLWTQSAQGTLVLRDGIGSYGWAGEVSLWVDQGGDATLADAQAASFAPVDGEINFGFRDGAYWFNGELRNENHAERLWIWWIEYSLLDYVDLYLVDLQGGVEHFSTGDRLPFSSRFLDHRQLNFGFELAPGGQREFFLRVQSSSSLQVPSRIVTPSVFAERNYHSNLGLGILYGTFFALALYNLILFVSFRDRTFLYYVIYVTSFALFQAVLNGFAFEYLWPNSPAWANRAVITIMPLMFVAMCQFCRSFLELERHSLWFDRLLQAIMAVYVGLAFCSLFVRYQLLVQLETAMVFVLIATIIGSIISALRASYRPALYFALAWAVLIVGMLLYASVSFGLLPKMFITEYGFQIGSAVEMILLSFALAYRINLLREENARIALETTRSLERRVAGRTKELNRALVDLGEANRQLEQASLRDGLTGVHNRRYLDNALAETWQQAAEAKQWLALIVLDLDRFKSINDELGHLAGDDCLKAVASTIGDALEDSDAVFARFGGEEFFIVLPNLSIEDARLLAERLRARVEVMEIHSGEHRFKITASFGVAALRPDGSSEFQELIRRADDAMYEAKQTGRNRVVTAAPRVVGSN